MTSSPVMDVISSTAATMDADDVAQQRWAHLGIAERLRVLRRARFALATATDDLVHAISPDLPRHRADSMAAEVLPVLAAIRFLELDARSILKPRRLGRRGRPVWLAGVESTVERVALGHVLIIGPSNYPLLLPGVQALQALAAGNRVTWKPGDGGKAVADVFLRVMLSAGLPSGLLRITGESVADATEALSRGAAKIVFTGSAATGRKVMHAAAESLTPVIMELSGADAVFVLPGADSERLLAALTLGMRLNGSQTCMAPRRLMLIGKDHGALIAKLQDRLRAMDPVAIRPAVRVQLQDLVAEAESQGARFSTREINDQMRPLLVTNARAEMRLAQSDIFAPVITVLQFADVAQALAADRLCPYALTATIFGEVKAARALAAQLETGSVLINDVIVPTVDPRVSFGGRRQSGFGVTRGAEGLLEMTAVRVLQVRRGNDQRHFQAPTEDHAELFAGAIGMSHYQGWGARLKALRRLIGAARKIKQ